jgi:hypothetical protein
MLIFFQNQETSEILKRGALFSEKSNALQGVVLGGFITLRNGGIGDDSNIETNPYGRVGVGYFGYLLHV